LLGLEYREAGMAVYPAFGAYVGATDAEDSLFFERHLDPC